MRFLPAFLLIASLFFSLFSAESFAQQKNNGTITVSPAYVEVTLTNAGEEQKIPIRFTNNSTQTVTLEMFPIDFNHADANGTIGFLSQQQGSYSYSLASYLSLEASQITIDPKESHVFNVLVTNRPDLTPGGHYAAIIGKVITGNQSSDLGAQVAPSLSSLIFLRKTGGERYNLSLHQTDRGESVSFFYPDQIKLQFQNEGNIHLVPYGTVEMTDMFGRVIRRGILNTSSFLVMPESRRNISVDLHKTAWSYPISLNTLTVKGNDSLKKTTFLYSNTSLYINPIFLLISIGVIVAGVLIRRRVIGQNNKTLQKVKKKPRIRSK